MILHREARAGITRPEAGTNGPLSETGAKILHREVRAGIPHPETCAKHVYRETCTKLNFGESGAGIRYPETSARILIGEADICIIKVIISSNIRSSS